jgi:hypothetical protein
MDRRFREQAMVHHQNGQDILADALYIEVSSP